MFSAIMNIKMVLLLSLLFVSACSRAQLQDDFSSSHEVMYFPAGIHKLDSIVSSKDHISIRGDGSGVTILVIPGGIKLTGREPRLSGFTLVGEDNQNTGITLENNYRVLISDVEIQNFELGLLSLCDFGERQWLHTYRDLYIYEGKDGSQRTYNPRIRGAELRYNGQKSKKGSWLPDGGFSNTHSFYGGRIAVPGTPLLIDGPTATSMFGTYIDISESPVVMTDRSAGLQLFGVHLDNNRRSRKRNIPALVLENPSYNRVKIFGQHANLVSRKLIRDADGKPVNPKYIFISPLKY